MTTEEIFQQVMDENCKDPLHRFAELVRADEREKWDTSDMAYRPGGLSVEQAEKQEKLCKYCGGIGRVVCDGRCMPEQEPVAWMFQHGETGRMSYVSNDGINSPEYFLSMNPRYGFVCALYTAPPKRPVKSYTGGEPQYATDAPKREWQGLTDEEVAIYSDMFNGVRLMKAIEALLKRRNT